MDPGYQYISTVGQTAGQTVGQTKDSAFSDSSRHESEGSKSLWQSAVTALGFGAEEHDADGSKANTDATGYSGGVRQPGALADSAIGVGSGAGASAVIAGAGMAGRDSSGKPGSELRDQSEKDFAYKQFGSDHGYGATKAGANAEKFGKERGHYENKSTVLPIGSQNKHMNIGEYGNQNIGYETGVPNNSSTIAAQVASGARAETVAVHDGAASTVKDTYRGIDTSLYDKHDNTTTQGYEPTDYYVEKTKDDFGMHKEESMGSTALGAGIMDSSTYARNNRMGNDINIGGTFGSRDKTSTDYTTTPAASYGSSDMNVGSMGDKSSPSATAAAPATAKPMSSSTQKNTDLEALTDDTGFDSSATRNTIGMSSFSGSQTKHSSTTAATTAPAAAPAAVSKTQVPSAPSYASVAAGFASTMGQSKLGTATTSGTTGSDIQTSTDKSNRSNIDAYDTSSSNKDKVLTSEEIDRKSYGNDGKVSSRRGTIQPVIDLKKSRIPKAEGVASGATESMPSGIATASQSKPDYSSDAYATKNHTNPTYETDTFKSTTGAGTTARKSSSVGSSGIRPNVDLSRNRNPIAEGLVDTTPTKPSNSQGVELQAATIGDNYHFNDSHGTRSHKIDSSDFRSSDIPGSFDSPNEYSRGNSGSGGGGNYTTSGLDNSYRYGKDTQPRTMGNSGIKPVGEEYDDEHHKGVFESVVDAVKHSFS